eukprot:scpid44964/ scgid32526/ 
MRPECVFCLAEPRQPGKLLKCLHKICNDCLPASIQEDGKILCSKCRLVTPCPPPGLTHEQVLVDDFMFDRSQHGRGDESMQAETSDKDALSRGEGHLTPPGSVPHAGNSAAACRDLPKGERCQDHSCYKAKVRYCRVHIKKELKHYCKRCREHICKVCKQESKHAKHIDQIGDMRSEAAALHGMLSERLQTLSPDRADREADELTQFSSGILEAAQSDASCLVESIRRSLNSAFENEISSIRNRARALLVEAERIQEQQRDLRDQHWKTYRGALRKFERIQSILQSTRSDVDCLKIGPLVKTFLEETEGNLREINFSLSSGTQMLRHWSPIRVKMCIDSMGLVVDNTDFDLSRCVMSLPILFYTYVGERINITAQVRTSDGFPVSQRALKASSIQLWAVSNLRISTVRIPIVGFIKGEVRAIVKFDTSGVFRLEVRLDTPSPIPMCFLKQSFNDSVWQIHEAGKLPEGGCACIGAVYANRAVIFDAKTNNPEFSMLTMPVLALGSAHVVACVRQQVNGLATIRAQEPLNDTCPGAIICIQNCPSGNLEIGLTSGDSGGRKANFHVLAASGNARCFGRPKQKWVRGELIKILPSPDSCHKFEVSYIITRGPI